MSVRSGAWIQDIQNPPVANNILNEHHRRVHVLKCEGPVEGERWNLEREFLPQ